MFFRLFISSTLVLKKFHLEPDNAEGNIVTIVARKAGLFAWILTHLFKILPETRLTVTPKDIRFGYKSIATEENVLITLKVGVSHIYCKYHRPVWLLVLSAAALLAGMILGGIAFYGGWAYLILGAVVALLLILLFHFNKSIAIVIATNSNTKYAIKFKPSFIEGQDVNLEKAKEVVKVIQDQIIKEQE